MSRPFPQVQLSKSVPVGSDEYERKKAAVLEELQQAIPKEFHLDQSIVDNPPLNVTDIPRSCGILSKEEIHITEDHDATSLAEAIAARKYTAVSVATAFCKRAAIAHQLTCCLTDFFMEEALERARFLDDYLQTNGTTIGPLHGVPVSVKEHMPIAGRHSSWGFLSTRALSDKDALQVEILRNAGAIFYVKTSQPQAIMHLESAGYHGRTLNPYNLKLTSGGSSGGEGTLNALRGSVLGLGSDIGGSIRCPAGFCNIHGFKPTSYLLSNDGHLPGGFAAELNILATGGPMCRSLRDVDNFMKLLRCADQHLRDPSIIPMPWTGLHTKIEGPIKLGIMMSDGAITPQPPIIRALEWAKSQILKSSHSSTFELKPFTPYGSAHANRMITEMYWPDGPKHVREPLQASGEPELLLSTWMLRYNKEEIGARAINDQRWQRNQFRCRFIEEWNNQDVDYVLAPVFVGPACQHETAKFWNYTALWNFVDYPGLVIPTPIKALPKGQERYPPDAPILSEEDQAVRELWEQGDFTDAPIALQLIARKYHDNQLIAAAAKIEDALGYTPFGQLPKIE
jgi:amidase